MKRFIAIIILGVLLLTPANTSAHSKPVRSHSGYAAHYRPGLMLQVSNNRGMKQVNCMVASVHYPLGTWVRVKSERFKDRVLSCRVTDVPQKRHIQSILHRRIVVELDFTSAKYICNIKRVAQEPPRRCPVTIWRLQ